MGREVYIIGAGMTKFGKLLDRNMKSLVEEAVTSALKHAGTDQKVLEAAYVGNAVQGLYNGQECIRGQVALRPMGIGAIPVVNVENACASGSTALYGAYLAVLSGAQDVVLALGMEKMYSEDKARTLEMFQAAMDMDVVEAFKSMIAMQKSSEENSGGEKKKEKVEKKSIFMDAYAMGARMHMSTYGTTQRQLASIAAKNHFHSSLNPYAQYQTPYTIEEVLASPEVSYPLTRLMCSPIGDGAAAVIVASKEAVKRLGITKPIKIAASLMGSGMDKGFEDEDISRRVSKKAYEIAGIGPKDIDLLEVHDATAFGELHVLEELGICKTGEGGPFAEAGHTKLGGKIPVNVSGGLECKGHPIGASGIAQIVEIVWQLRGEAGKRQVQGAKVGMAENGGGALGTEEAALCIHILKA